MRSDGSGSGSGLLHSSVFVAPKSSTSQPLQKFKSSLLNVNRDSSVHVLLPLNNTYKKTLLTFNRAKNNVRVSAIYLYILFLILSLIYILLIIYL